MLFLVALAILVIGLLIWQWRAGRAQTIAKVFEREPATTADFPRKLAMKRQTGQARFDRVDDPREAAVVMMSELARAGRDMTPTAREVISDLILSEFELTEADADALIVHAEFLLRHGPGAQTVMMMMTDRVVRSPGIGPKQIVDLDGMLVAVSEADGRPTPEQLSLLQAFRDRTGVQI